MILTEGRDHQILTCSDAWIDRMGYSREDIVGADLAGFVIPDHREHYNRSREKFLEGSYEEGNWTPTFITKTGEKIYTKLNVKIDKSSSEWRVIHTILHVTELQQARETAESYLKEGLNSYTIVDEDFNFVYASNAALRTFETTELEEMP